MNNKLFISPTLFRFVFFGFLLILVMILRLYATNFGYTSDVITFLKRSQLAQSCFNYLLMCRDANVGSYGLLSLYENGIIYKITKYFFSIVDYYNFQIIYAFYLSIIDFLITISIFLVTRSYLASLLFTISPTSILISGMHIQIDNVSILFATLGFFILQKNNIKTGALLFALSLMHKLFFLFLPFFLIVLFIKDKILNKFLIFLSYSLFFYVFFSIPQLIIKPGNNIKIFMNDIFTQSDTPGTLIHLLTFFKFSSFQLTLLMILMSYILLILLKQLKVVNEKNIIFFYMITLLVFTPRLHEQYVVILSLGFFYLWEYKIFLVANFLTQLFVISHYLKLSYNLNLQHFWPSFTLEFPQYQHRMEVFFNIYFTNFRLFVLIQLLVLVSILLLLIKKTTLYQLFLLYIKNINTKIALKIKKNIMD